jgi:hypothetical protein
MYIIKRIRIRGVQNICVGRKTLFAFVRIAIQNSITRGIHMNKTVEKMMSFNLQGNIISPVWFQTITKNNKPDLLAINILADVIYWYKPVIIRDEHTGKVLRIKQKFKADKLQKTYSSYAELFNVSRRKVKYAFDLLVKIGVLTREFRTVKTKEMTLPNVMFIDIDITILQKTITPPAQKVPPYPTKNTPPILQNSVGYPTEKCNTYTETTTETTTDIKEIHKEKFAEESAHTPPERSLDQKKKKFAYGEFVRLTKDEYRMLEERLGDELGKYLESLDFYIGSTGKRYKSHHHTILSWWRKDHPNLKPPVLLKNGKTPLELYYAKEKQRARQKTAQQSC